MAKCKACGTWFASVGKRDLCPDCAKALKRLGSYVAPVTHARWVGDGLKGNWCYCSNCEKAASFFMTSDYCPNCGAKMDGGEGE